MFWNFHNNSHLVFRFFKMVTIHRALKFVDVQNVEKLLIIRSKRQNWPAVYCIIRNFRRFHWSAVFNLSSNSKSCSRLFRKKIKLPTIIAFFRKTLFFSNRSTFLQEISSVPRCRGEANFCVTLRVASTKFFSTETKFSDECRDTSSFLHKKE